MKTWTNPYVALILALAGLSTSMISSALEDAASIPAGPESPHAHHHHSMTERVRYEMADYMLPQIQLTRQNGKSVALAEELNDGRPVILNFIYTTCTTVCPLTSHVFAEVQEKLGSTRERVHMVSISIDPEQDTPGVLAKYAQRFGAGTQWQFYTGTVEASIAAQRAFNVYRGDKMSHNPVTFIRISPEKPWLRIEGFAKSDELLAALRDLASSNKVQISASGDSNSAR